MSNPKIRFKDFTDAWEQRKLSELATMHARIGWQNLRTSEFLDDGDYMLITGTDFDDGHINFSTCHYVEKERYDQDKHIQISDGSILITKDGTLGKVAYVKGLQKPATLNAGVFNVEIKNENEVDGKYLFQYLKAPFLMDYVSQKATGGTIKHLNQNILVDFPVVLPEKPEQEKIGQYFEDIDNLITLHQRKCDKTKELKKYMLQKMFPKNSEKNPEIRFAGFTDDWEQHKLSELADYSNGTGHEEYVVEQGKYELITLKSINSEGELVSSEKYIDEEFETLKQGTLIMMLSEQARGMLGMTTVIPCNDRYILNQRVAALTLHDKIDASFLTKAINNKQAYFEQMGAGTKVQNISKGHVENCIIEIPCFEEQKQVGEYFNNLDNLITLHLRKCDDLKELKKYMLQNMFPTKG